HVPMATHPNPRRVAVVGGGDGGSIREMLKHPSAEEAVLIESDAGVVEAAKRWLPSLSSGLEDKRVQIVHTDVKGDVAQAARGEVTPSDAAVGECCLAVMAPTRLSSEKFSQTVPLAIDPYVTFTVQTSSRLVNQNLLSSPIQSLARTFPIVKPY